MTSSVVRFRVEIPEEDLADLRQRLGRTRWPESATADGWAQGVPLAYLQELCSYWAEGYDWRVAEARLNALGQFATEIDGLEVCFIHVRSPHHGALPLIMTHGWPGSVVEFLKVIGPLTDPVSYGGSAADAFDVVCPSLPGFGFSGKPARAGWGVERIAAAWAQLMARLGYQRYGAEGSDWGTSISTSIGAPCSRKNCSVPHAGGPRNASPTSGTGTSQPRVATSPRLNNPACSLTKSGPSSASSGNH